MKTIQFLRHCRLIKPYDNYDTLSFDQISDVATGKLDPDIDLKGMRPLKLKFSNVSKTELILHSCSKRTVQTAQFIKNVLGKDRVKMVESKNLDEIKFDPKKLLSKEEYEKCGMEGVRISLFKALLDNNLENIDAVYRRISRLEKELKQLPYKYIFCVTHGFYMRVLQIYFLRGKKTPNLVTPKDLQEAVNYDYLDGFEIQLDP